MEIEREEREKIGKDWKRKRGEMRISGNWLIVTAFDLECTKQIISKVVYRNTVHSIHTYYILHQDYSEHSQCSASLCQGGGTAEDLYLIQTIIKNVFGFGLNKVKYFM